MTVLLLISGVLVYMAEDSLKSDADRDREDFAEAEIANSMGRWDRSVELYDQIVSRNQSDQSNQQALKKKAYALEKLGEGKRSGQKLE